MNSLALIRMEDTDSSTLWEGVLTYSLHSDGLMITFHAAVKPEMSHDGRVASVDIYWVTIQSSIKRL